VEWRIGIILLVFFLLATGSSEYCRKTFSVKIYRVLAFESTENAKEQAIHFLMGILALSVFRFVADYFDIGWLAGVLRYVFIEYGQAGSCVAAALTGAVLKETFDIIVSGGHWKAHDSCVDISFWILGGLVAPAMMYHFVS